MNIFSTNEQKTSKIAFLILLKNPPPYLTENRYLYTFGTYCLFSNQYFILFFFFV